MTCLYFLMYFDFPRQFLAARHGMPADISLPKMGDDEHTYIDRLLR